MNHATDVPADNGGTFDPRQAADLLEQATKQARRRLQPTPPWLLATRAVLVLAALGAIWLSVRGQHPYRGPTSADIPIMVAFIVINFAVTVAVRQHAIAGVRGRSRLSPGEIAVLTLSWLATVVVMLVLLSGGVSYGRYPTTVLIIPGLAWAAVMVARAGWGSCGTGLAVAVVGVAGLFAGPAGSWAVAAAGLAAVLLARAIVIAVRQRG